MYRSDPPLRRLAFVPFMKELLAPAPYTLLLDFPAPQLAPLLKPARSTGDCSR